MYSLFFTAIKFSSWKLPKLSLILNQVKFGRQTWVQRASSMNGESEKCFLQRLHGEDGTRENLPSPGSAISVSSGFAVLPVSSVILELPAISKSVSDFTEELMVLGASTGPCEVVGVDSVVVVDLAAEFLFIAAGGGLLVVVIVIVIVVVTVEVLVLTVDAVVVLNGVVDVVGDEGLGVVADVGDVIKLSEVV